MNVSHIIRRHVAEQPEKTAIIFGDRRIPYFYFVTFPGELEGKIF